MTTPHKIQLIGSIGVLSTVIFLFGQMSVNYSIKHTDIKISIGRKYIIDRNPYRDIDPFTIETQDTVLINDIKEGFVLYSQLKHDTVEYKMSTRLSYFQEDITDSIK